MSKILVTGAAGFVASHIVDNLVDENEVFALDDLSGGFEYNINPKATFLEGSVSNTKFIEHVFQQYKFDYIFHLAAYAAEGLSHFIRRFNYMNNLYGSVNLINEAVNGNVKCFCFFSSAGCYGNIPTPMKETDQPRPCDPYGVAKYAVELDLQTAKNMFGLNYIIFRPYNIFGPRQNLDDRYRNLIGVFINQIMSGKPLSIFGDGKQTRAFSYIEDIAPVVANSIKNERAYGEVFNLGARSVYTVNQVADIIKEQFGGNNVNHLPERQEVKHMFCDTTKSREYFGDYPETPIEEGIKKMVEWAKKRGVNEPKYFDNIEITKNLPKSWLK